MCEERRKKYAPLSLATKVGGLKSNEFLGPGCFCSVFVPRDQAVFTEAAIFILTSGPFSGEYVAQCAKGECGYLGQSCFLLKIEPGAHISARGSAN